MAAVAIDLGFAAKDARPKLHRLYPYTSSLAL